MCKIRTRGATRSESSAIKFDPLLLSRNRFLGDEDEEEEEEETEERIWKRETKAVSPFSINTISYLEPMQCFRRILCSSATKR